MQQSVGGALVVFKDTGISQWSNMVCHGMILYD